MVAEDLADSNPQKALLVKYKNDYESKYDDMVSTFGGHAYDALTILVAAVCSLPIKPRVTKTNRRG